MVRLSVHMSITFCIRLGAARATAQNAWYVLGTLLVQMYYRNLHYASPIFFDQNKMLATLLLLTVPTWR